MADPDRVASAGQDAPPSPVNDEKRASSPEPETTTGDDDDVAPESLTNPYFVDATPAAGARRKLPEWLDHFNARDLKKLFKCSLAVWIMTVLILINPTLKVIGQAAFLGCIILFIAPPSGIVFIQLIACISLLLGLSSAWAWGTISMKAALATRPSSEVQAKYAVLQQEAQNATNPTTYAAIQVYNGYFLDTRVSITYFCMMGIFVYFVSRIRVAYPKLILVQMMACIVSVIYFTTAPLLPTFNGTLGKTFVIPAAIAAGISLVCNVLVFPTSSTSEALDGMKKILDQMPTFLDACAIGLHYPDLDMRKDLLTGTRVKIFATYKQLDPIITFLPIDFSVGRWSSEDLSNLNGPFRRLLTSFTALVEIHRQKQVRKEKATEALSRQGSDEESNADLKTVELGQHQINQTVEFHMKSYHPARNSLIKQSLTALSGPAEHLIDSCKECLVAVGEALTQSNVIKKSPNHAEMAERHIAALKKLQEHRDEFINSTSHWLPEISHHVFNDEGLMRVHTGDVPSLTGLMMGLLLQERLFHLADALEKLLSKIIELEHTRTKVRVWMPKRLMGLLGWIAREDSSEDALTAADLGDTLTRVSTVATMPTRKAAKNKKKKKAEPDPNSARTQLASMRVSNSRQRSKGGRFLLGLANWFGSTEGIFALRVAAVSIALSVPAVCRSSSGFFYRQKGMWAVIMAQLTLVPYTADLVYGIVVRTVGTILGGVIGMVAWYIGAGSGDGNPYGLAAIMAVAIVLLMWWRLFSSPALMAGGIMMGATAYLVAMYSWMDTHNPTYGNPGVGYSVFWRRLLLVLIGFGGALIINFLPKPPSANRHYRSLLADVLASVRDRYALFASNWRDPSFDLREVVEEEGLAMAEVLLSIAGPMKLTVFEFSSSNFDTKTLCLVCHQCMLLNEAITELLVNTVRLTDGQRKSIIPATGSINEDLITELMAVLSLVQQALKSGDPLPAVLPTPLFTKAIMHARRHVEEGILGESGRISRENLDEESLRKYIVILNATVQLLAALDELVLVLKRAVGETSNITMIQTV